MATEFVQVQASEQGELREFLLRSFAADPSSIQFRAEVLHWKYFSGHPAWNRARSFAIRKDGETVAHGGVWPVTLVTPEAEITAIHLIDWAANRSAVGAGVHLLRRMSQLGDVLLTIGGSDDTRAVLPKLGYKQCGELRRYARVIRPWLQFSTTPRKDFRSAVKLIRNSARNLRALPTSRKNAQVSRVSSFSGVLDDLTICRPSRSVVSSRTAAGLDHLMTCPAGRFSGFLVTGEHFRGYFVLAEIGRQSRIIDIGTDATDPESWRTICVLAARTAAENPEICEIVAGWSNQQAQAPWLQMGFTHARTEPIFAYDPRQRLSTGTPLNLNMADGDLCFLSDPNAPYLG